MKWRGAAAWREAKQSFSETWRWATLPGGRVRQHGASKTVLCGKHGGGLRCQVVECGGIAHGKTALCGKHGVGDGAKWQGAAARREAREPCAESMVVG